MEMEIVFPGAAQVDAVSGPMTITTNQDGTAPPPFALFLASIGTCAGIYVLGFCQHRGLPTDGIKIVQRMSTNPATRMVDNIELDIQVPDSFPERYHDALIRAADQCAVKKHLQQPPAFNVHTTTVATVRQTAETV
jgi:ribosomal protein S12 methylthiotransferase accessory factor